ncbi:MAG: Elongation factor Ts [Microgenomates group bacterium GW2011_GWC1_37_8]|nr:MAG: Elongation factor Ts [Microgenomates group bacterium GW2011_GWC1_37_8]
MLRITYLLFRITYRAQRIKMKITADQIRELRDKTGAPVMRAKKLLEEVIGDLPADATHQALQAGMKKAEDILKKKGFEKVQTASMSAKDSNELLQQEFIKEPGKKVEDLVKEVIAKTGENIRVGRIWRIVLGE